MNIHELIQNMESCEQSPGQSTLDHGVAVLLNMHDLIRGTPRGPVPEWYIQNHGSIVDALPDVRIWGTYAIYHDCGKWKVREVDEQGRQHFPDHARASSDLWLSVAWTSGVMFDRVDVADLMRNDMAMHTYTADEMRYSAILDHPDLAAVLLLSSLAELHANAPMFGGFESVSFKIKAKHVKRRGAQVCRRLFESEKPHAQSS